MQNTAVAPNTDQQRPTRLPYHQVEALDKGQQVRVFLPGASKETIDLKVDASKLILSASVSEYTVPNNARLVHQEINSGNFEISFELSDRFNVKGISAKFENGVLEINLPFNTGTIQSISIV